jgi:hypothetical protein
MLLKTIATIILLISLPSVLVDAEDTFNYHETNFTKRSFAPKDWNRVTCKDVETCVRQYVLPKLTRWECAHALSCHLCL